MPNGAGWRPGAPQGRPVKRVRKKGSNGIEKTVTFWYHLGDFGHHFGPSWAPRVFQNQLFGNHFHEKSMDKKDAKIYP